MSALDDAWQAALAAEHQAVFGYELLGPRLTGDQLRLAVTCSDAHEALRDATETGLTAAGLDPVQSRADYPSLYPVSDSAAARTLAARLEDGCAAAWRYLYATAAAESGARPTALRGSAHMTAVRGNAQRALTSSAVRATRWRVAAGADAATTAFPGV